jgi:DNA repair exonuclease SbcCD nuclease subunit
MKIAILSDFHFGFGVNTEREEDPYDSVREALSKCSDVDLIIIGGDLFDTRNPDAATLSKAMELLTKPLLEEKKAKLIDVVGNKDKESISKMALLGIPVVAIHGTHERRVKGLINPVEALERAGFLIHLHCNGVVFERDEERVCIQGMSGVPDQYAESVLREWSPKPLENAFNIFVLHQSITEFLYAPHTIDLNTLPKGFDLYIDGHVHEARQAKYDGKPLLIPGSLIPTQLRREESEKAKGFWIVETENFEIKWVPLENQRTFYYIEFENKEKFEIRMNEILKEKHAKRPIVRIHLLEANETLSKDIEAKFSDKVIISFKREKIEEKLPTKTLEEHKLSVEELGKKLLAENLKKFNLDPKFFENVFELLANNKIEEAMELLNKIPETKKEEVKEKPKIEEKEEKKTEEGETKKEPERKTEKQAEKPKSEEATQKTIFSYSGK